MIKSAIINRKSQILLLLILTVVVVSCRPRGILHSWEMRDVLVDLHKTDALLQLNGYTTSGYLEERNIYYAQVLEEHGITQAEFDSSLVWYTAHPKLFDKIYPKVIAQLEAEEAEFLALHEEELNAGPNEKEEIALPPFTPARLDSVLWVSRNGYPSTWSPVPSSYNGPILP